MQLFKSAALILISASAAMAFAPASLKTCTSGVALSMSSDDSCDDRREFVSKVSYYSFNKIIDGRSVMGCRLQEAPLCAPDFVIV
jgi:hypothetical protein